MLAGLRIGALLSVHLAHERDDIDGLVLLDVPRSGRAFLREIRLRQSAALGDEESDDGSVTALGNHLPRRRRARPLGDQRAQPHLPAVRAGADDVEARSRGHRPGSPTRSGAHVEVATTEDLEDLLATEKFPVEARRQISTWMDGHYAATYPVAERIAETSRSELTGDSWVEHPCWLGPRGLFGIVYEPRVRRTSTMVVFTPSAHLPHGGPLRIWPELSRALAEEGIAWCAST